MKVTLSPTKAFKTIEGVRCRVWEGTSDEGVECFALIPVIAHHKNDDPRAGAFTRELFEIETPPSDEAVQCFDLRYFID